MTPEQLDAPLTDDRLATMISDLAHTGELSMLYRMEIADAITHLRTALSTSSACKAAAVAAQVAVTANRKGFPILGQRGAYVDWQLVADHGGQANTNHGQTVARLAERGGLSWCELFAVLHNQRFQRMDANDAMIACRALEARYLAALIGGAALPRL